MRVRLDEHWLTSTEHLRADGTLGDWYASSGWDPDDSFSGCHYEGLYSFLDPYGLAYCAEAEIDDIKARVREWSAPALASGVAIDVVVLEGNQPAVEIVARAAALPASLIVLGTHGRSGFDRLLLGSVTEKVLRKASGPVMTVPPPTASAARRVALAMSAAHSAASTALKVAARSAGPVCVLVKAPPVAKEGG